MPLSEPFALRFWGVRGSVPVARDSAMFFGGNTSCIEVRCGDRLFILDAGTGIWAMGEQVAHQEMDILLSHTHIDHIIGLPMFRPLYKPENTVHIWAGNLLPQYTLGDTLGRLMSSPLFPLSLAEMRATLTMHDFLAGQEIHDPRWESEGIRVHTLALNHPDGATGYRIEYLGKRLCYITDHEHGNEAVDAAVIAFAQNADVLIYDTTYIAENYDKHRGWGHSTWQCGIAFAQKANAHTLVLFHHDPYATDDELMRRRVDLLSHRSQMLIAREGLALSLMSGKMLAEKNQESLNPTRHGFTLVERLTAIGIALSAQSDIQLILEMILEEATHIAQADGGTIYFLNDAEELEFAIVRNHKLGISYGGSCQEKAPFKSIPLRDAQGNPNLKSIAAHATHTGNTIHIRDVYSSARFDFDSTKAFDSANQYHTQSMLAVPLVNHKGEPLGCLQLINARHHDNGEIIPFDDSIQELVRCLASQASIILDNKILIQGQKNLLEAFIKMIAQAIDAKSPYTGAHCERVPVLTNMLAAAACEANEGTFKDFSLSEEEKYELHIAGWMHDCGKVTTPVHVMDKSTKLETIFDRIELVVTRFELLKRDAEIAWLRAMAHPESDAKSLEKAYLDTLQTIEDDLAFIRKTNIGGEFLSDEAVERLHTIATRWAWQKEGVSHPALTEEELHNLRTRKGTLTDEERKIMNDHMVHTCAMLEALPFPKHLRRVPEYAGGHHERMDGKGYPKGIKAGTMSIPARMMAVADVFEALTAADRPYKSAKKLSESMQIIALMKRDHHLDPDIVDFFITSKTYLAFARKYLSPDLIDEVDEQALLAIRPKSL